MIERHRVESLERGVQDQDNEPDGIDEVLDDDLLEYMESPDHDPTYDWDLLEYMESPDHDPTYDWDLLEIVLARCHASGWRAAGMLSLRKRLGVYDGFVLGTGTWIRRGPRPLTPEHALGGHRHRWAWCDQLPHSSCTLLASILDVSSQTTVGLIRLSARDFTVVERVLRNLSAVLSPRFLDNPMILLTLVVECQAMILSEEVNEDSKKIMAARASVGTGNDYHYYMLGEKKEAFMNDSEKLKNLSRDVLQVSEYVALVGVRTQAWARMVEKCRVESERFVKATATRTAGTNVNPNVDVAMALEEILDFASNIFSNVNDTAKAQQWECDVLQQAIQAMIAQLNQEQSTRVANASWREATSVTTITIITLVFLPGTYTSTLFAIPWFAETVRGGDLEFQRTLYLALTSALTIVVVSLWYL
ncbi:hypothetical protein QBC34DRAFT_163822 [Podospora aff. communis PSN243]|uniref:Uncharacterized protein n=1 Tax=Podospora aff. communis PSN243 TaxID=3040156 RepID=A0AAV9GD76_9PEZI|nr:hypothetical protein QBC34DRAFT_163822 [Podospora aff. communis PSN243]